MTLASAPYVGADPTGRRYIDLFAPADADELLSSRGLRHPQLRVVRDGSPLVRSEFTSRRTVGGVAFDDLIEPARATNAFRRGATLVFQSLHTFWPPLGAFCAALSAELGHPCQANAYLSPLDARGLDVHYDTHDVFALQVSGTKAWDVFAPVFPNPLGHQHWAAVRRQEQPETVQAIGDPVLSVTLTPGDSLFVPRGFVHRAQTTSEASLHITVGVHARTWHAALKTLVDRAARDERFRTTVPVPSSPTDLEGFRRLLHDWLDDQDLSGLVAFDDVRRWIESAGYHRGVLADSLAAITDASIVRHRHRTNQLVLTDEGPETVLRTPDRVLRFPARAQPALAAVLAVDRLVVADLSDLLDGPSRPVFVRRLVADGVLRLDHDRGASGGHRTP